MDEEDGDGTRTQVLVEQEEEDDLCSLNGREGLLYLSEDGDELHETRLRRQLGVLVEWRSCCSLLLKEKKARSGRRREGRPLWEDSSEKRQDDCRPRADDDTTWNGDFHRKEDADLQK